MSVIVMGIEMPKKCDECHFYRYWDEMASSCRAFNKTKWIDDCDMKKERHPDCPLIEVPPHGRLIDADCCNDYFYEHMSDDMMIAAMNAINEMPTIIESDNE